MIKFGCAHVAVMIAGININGDVNMENNLSNGSKKTMELKVIIFSYNRPAQLDLLLRSMKRFTDFKDIYVTYMHDNEYKKGYEIVIKENPDIHFVYRRKGLKTYVLEWLTAPLTAFFCDDDILIGQVSKNDSQFKKFIKSDLIACLSLRLGKNVNYSFDRNISLEVPDDDEWYWRAYSYDWGYPMSVSGHIFKTEDIKPLIEMIEFDTPTKLEGQLSQIPIGKPFMLRYPKQKCVEAPINIVQTECLTNRTGDVSVEYLNEEFMKGQRIDLDKVLETKFNSPHQLIDIEWRKK